MTHNKNIEKDSLNARCSGLSKGFALTKSENKKVFAQEVTKENGPFYCPVCLSDVIVRKCADKIDHFAHNARLSPAFTSKNQILHDKCKEEICNYLKTIFPEGNWETERPIPINKYRGWDNEIIPDISGRFGGKKGVPIAIEIQKSSYTINKIFKKTVEYSKRGIYVLWVVPLEEDLGNEPFRPRLYEKYLHSIYFGRTYYWTPKSSPNIIPIHYSPENRYIEQSTWYDTDYGEERNAGGIYLTYKTIKIPNYINECTLKKILSHEKEQFLAQRIGK